MYRPLFAALGSLLIGGVVHDDELFETGFEGRDYLAGQALDGQQGWTSLVSPDAAEVVEDRLLARSGRRAVRCWGGSDLEDVGGGLLDGASKPAAATHNPFGALAGLLKK